MRWLVGRALPPVLRYPAFLIQLLLAAGVCLAFAYYIVTATLMVLAGLGFGTDCSSGCTTSL